MEEVIAPDAPHPRPNGRRRRGAETVRQLATSAQAWADKLAETCVCAHSTRKGENVGIAINYDPIGNVTGQTAY